MGHSQDVSVDNDDSDNYDLTSKIETDDFWTSNHG